MQVVLKNVKKNYVLNKFNTNTFINTLEDVLQPEGDILYVQVGGGG